MIEMFLFLFEIFIMNYLKKYFFIKVVIVGMFIFDFLEKSVFICFLVGGKKYEFILIGWIYGGKEGNVKCEVVVNEFFKKCVE